MSGGTPCPICGKPMPPSGDACPACTALAVTAAAAVEPPRLAAGRYRLERLLGRGGAKDVWLAHDTVLDRPVALSRLRAGAADEGARARVAREARVTARLGESLRIVTVHDAIEDDGMLMIVTRYMAGGSLAERLAEAPDRRLPAGEVLRVAEELAEALAHAHAHGVLHRDVKPANVWLAADGGAALGDFGIALAASEPADEPVGVGTPFYVAPETVRGEPSTPSSDLYGLGATLYELLAGRPPFIGDSVPIVLERHLNVAPQPLSAQVPEIPAELDALVLRLLAKTPDERPGSAAAVRDAVVAARRASWQPPSERSTRRVRVACRYWRWPASRASARRAWPPRCGLPHARKVLSPPGDGEWRTAAPTARGSSRCVCSCPTPTGCATRC
jgi:serine/threonine protein kinase